MIWPPLPSASTTIRVCSPEAAVTWATVSPVGGAGGVPLLRSTLKGPPVTPIGKSSPPVDPIDDDGFVKGRAVRADLEMKIVISCETDFGPAGKARLVEQARGIRRGILIDLQLMPSAFMIEKGGRAGQGQAVCQVGRGIDAEFFGEFAAAARGHLSPCATVPDDQKNLRPTPKPTSPSAGCGRPMRRPGRS